MVMALVIGPDETAAIKALVEKAAANVVPHATMVEAHAAQKCPFDAPAQTIAIPRGVTVTLSIEEHLPGAQIRHLSVSTARGLPMPVVIEMLMREFGFHGRLRQCRVWLESIGDGNHAVNVCEPLDGDWEPFMIKGTA